MDFPIFPFDDTAAPEAAVSFHFEEVAFDLPDEHTLTEWLLTVGVEEGKPFHEANYIFCSDEYLLRLNIEHLQHDYYTDVITFPYDDEAIYGDIFISTERVADNAATHNVSFLHELCRVMVHGVLHLAGYGDKTKEEEVVMRAREDHYLANLPFPWAK